MDPCGPSHENERDARVREHCRSNQAVLNAAELPVWGGARAGGAAEKGWELYQEATWVPPATGTFLRRQRLPKLFQRHE